MMVTIRLGPYTLSLRPLTSLAAAAGIVLTIALGQWQTGRAQYKDALQERQDALSHAPALRLGDQLVVVDEALLRRVEVRGEFDPRFTVFVDNKIYKHRPGFHVATALRIAGTQRYVLVNRGWIAGSGDRKPPAVITPSGEQRIEGIAMAYGERFIELSNQVAEGNVWQNLVLERYRQATKLDLQPILIQQDSALDDGLVRDWPRPDLKRNTHLAYAFQWYALSLAILIYFLVTHVRRSAAPKQ